MFSQTTNSNDTFTDTKLELLKIKTIDRNNLPLKLPPEDVKSKKYSVQVYYMIKT